jgi:hypothetical protein
MNSIYENNSQMGNRLLGYFQQEIKSNKKKVVEPTSTNLVFSSMPLVAPFSISHPHFRLGIQSDAQNPINLNLYSLNLNTFRVSSLKTQI